MDVLHIMKTDHESIRSMIAAFLAADGIAAKRKIFSDLEREIAVHTAVEEGYLYPEIGELFAGSDVLIDVCLANHAVLTKLSTSIGKLLAKPVAEHVNLSSKIDELAIQIAKHIELQEQSLMPKIRQMIPTQEREDLGQVMLDMKADAAAGVDISVPKMNASSSKQQSKSAGKRKRA